MKKWLLIVLLIFYSNDLLANQQQGIEVVGKASVMLIPDQFSLTVHIKERGKSASKTKALVDNKSNLIVKMFVEQGIEPSAIDSSQVRMFPIYEKPSINIDRAEIKTKVSSKDKITFAGKALSKESQVHMYFEVSRTLTINFNELSVYDRVLDKVVKLGVSHISPIEMSFKDTDGLYQQALFQAIDNAKLKADKIAQKAGVEIAGLISLRESPYHAPSRYKMASEASLGFNSQVTEKSVSAQVIVIYKIKQ